MKKFVYIFAFLLSACGFTPLYGTQNVDNGTNLSLQQIQVTPLEGRLGQLLTNALRENLAYNTANNSVVYDLIFSVTEELNQFGFNQDRSTTRESYTQTVNFTLVNLDTQEEVTSGVVVSRTAYDVVQSDFSNFKAKQDAQERLVKETTQRITIKLATYFKNH